MSYQKPQLSVWERLTLVAAIVQALGNGLYTSIMAPFRGNSGSAKFSNHVRLAIIRSLTKGTTVRHSQSLMPGIDRLYPAFAKKQGFEPRNVTLADGTRAYWIGNPDARKVILWFHGGGYNLPPDSGHLPFATSLVATAGPHLAILMLSYNLAPHAIYPHQLRQAVELLRYTLTELKHSPSDVSIAGDSAGGNLALGLLSHLLHPHPEISPLELSAPLAAAILLAPWSSFRTDWPSTTYNSQKDLVGPYSNDLWYKSFLGGKLRDAYNEPLSAEERWWAGLEGKVRQVLVCGGGDEVLVDSIRALDKVLEAAHPDVTMVIAEGEWHDRPCIAALGGGGEQADAIASFVKSRL